MLKDMFKGGNTKNKYRTVIQLSEQGLLWGHIGSAFSFADLASPLHKLLTDGFVWCRALM